MALRLGIPEVQGPNVHDSAATRASATMVEGSPAWGAAVYACRLKVYKDGGFLI